MIISLLNVTASNNPSIAILTANVTNHYCTSVLEVNLELKKILAFVKSYEARDNTDEIIERLVFEIKLDLEKMQNG